MMNERDLKIELRAVVYGSGAGNRVLEYRFSPDQNLSIEIDAVNWWQRLEKKLFPGKYMDQFDTYWRIPHVFSNYEHFAHLYEKYDDQNWIPIWVRDNKEFEEYKNKFKTYGDLRDWQMEWNDKFIEKWEKRRAEYLKKQGDWY